MGPLSGEVRICLAWGPCFRSPNMPAFLVVEPQEAKPGMRSFKPFGLISPFPGRETEALGGERILMLQASPVDPDRGPHVLAPTQGWMPVLFVTPFGNLSV